MIVCCLLIFFSKSTSFQNSFRNTTRASNSLDPDQARYYVGPDLGPNCLQRLQQTTLVGKVLALKALLSILILHTLLSNFYSFTCRHVSLRAENSMDLLSEASCSGSRVFSKRHKYGFSRTRVNYAHAGGVFLYLVV